MRSGTMDLWSISQGRKGCGMAWRRKRSVETSGSKHGRARAGSPVSTLPAPFAGPRRPALYGGGRFGGRAGGRAIGRARLMRAAASGREGKGADGADGAVEGGMAMQKMPAGAPADQQGRRGGRDGGGWCAWPGFSSPTRTRTTWCTPCPPQLPECLSQSLTVSQRRV